MSHVMRLWYFPSSVNSFFVRRRPHFQTWISLKPVDQSWSHSMCSITGVGKRLHKVLGQIGSKLRFPWHASSFIFDRTVIKVADNQDRHKSSAEFDVRSDQTTHSGVTCPWMTKILHFRTWISLRLADQSWSNFVCGITGGRERLGNVLRQIGSKLWCPWQQKAPIDL